MNAIPTAKDAAREVIDRLPDQSTWHDLAYELYVNEKIEQGLAAGGRTVLHDTLIRDLPNT